MFTTLFYLLHATSRNVSMTKLDYLDLRISVCFIYDILRAK